MKYSLEIQSAGFNVDTNEIVTMVKDSLKAKKVVLSKAKDLKIYYVTDTKIVYYTCTYNEEKVTGEIYLV